jgi:hypothetical protein
MLSANPREKGWAWLSGIFDFRFLGGRRAFVERYV